MHPRDIDLTNKLRELERARYKSLVLCGPPLSGKTALALAVCEEYKARYIDFAEKKLPHITFPTLGVYGANEFYQWIKTEANASQTPLCIDEIEPLLATFPSGHLESFFGMLSWLEVRHPVLIVTRLETFLRKSNFPSERIYYTQRVALSFGQQHGLQSSCLYSPRTAFAFDAPHPHRGTTRQLD